eukprot:g13020.t1
MNVLAPVGGRSLLRLKQSLDLRLLLVALKPLYKRRSASLQTPQRSYLIVFASEQLRREWLWAIGLQGSRLKRGEGRVGSGHSLMLGTLHAAAAIGNLESLSSMLAKLKNKGEADGFNQVDAQGCTPLHVAAMNGQAGAVQLLLAARSDPALLNSAGLRAFGVAVRVCQLATVRALWYSFGQRPDAPGCHSTPDCHVLVPRGDLPLPCRERQPSFASSAHGGCAPARGDCKAALRCAVLESTLPRSLPTLVPTPQTSGGKDY